MLHNPASDVATQLRKLTDASRTQQRHTDAAVRRLAEQVYNNIYEWLEEHQIKFVYDRSQNCYVEVEDNDA